MKHRWWKIGFGISWIPAAFWYWIWIEAYLYDPIDAPIFQLGAGAIWICLMPLFPVIITQAILGYFAFRQ